MDWREDMKWRMKRKHKYYVAEPSSRPKRASGKMKFGVEWELCLEALKTDTEGS
jgi:hypothetical protein